MLNFVGTRDSSQNCDFKNAVLSPNANFGGLWTLKKIPQIDFSTYQNLDYKNLCEKIFQALDLNLNSKILDSVLNAYESFDDKTNPAPLNFIQKNLAIQELYHGKTRAFKDMALAPFGKLFSLLAKEKKEKYLILTATSGDTGPATLESFKNLENIEVVCLYPKGGTSDVQALQMTTQDAPNLHVFGIEGNFDDAQGILKSLIQDLDFKNALQEKNFLLSAANSVNFGRIAFQIIYHIWGYLCYIKTSKVPFGTPIKTIIPSGNFGNALGAFFAKKMGLPLEKIIIASNPNNILSDFINTGIYDISHRNLKRTYSPAMDILKSSNIERILFALFGDQETKKFMHSLETKQSYSLNQTQLKTLQEYFEATYCEDEKCLEIIKNFYDKNLLIDPHTANAIFAHQQLNPQESIICSTAEWSKFAPIVIKAVTKKQSSDKEAIEKILKDQNLNLSPHIEQLFAKPIYHQEVLKISEVKDKILQCLNSTPNTRK
ncbi:threonine synthase [Helicobacter sp. faydin-H20]|uniref:threonine synthase n=1 Tax=Helicobacter anatolicus TaxID=2905874 RepID=UPI001E433DDB|nr:threonine synthase [Helicobacter anatolicus]MCE3037273.1 threonine synthase [Helicobacter anatolicus]